MKFGLTMKIQCQILHPVQPAESTARQKQILDKINKSILYYKLKYDMTVTVDYYNLQTGKKDI